MRRRVEIGFGGKREKGWIALLSINIHSVSDLIMVFNLYSDKSNINISNSVFTPELDPCLQLPTVYIYLII